ncbi:MAG: hypothetical protein AB7N71_00880 [Phycisphaerae bacterium]
MGVTPEERIDKWLAAAGKSRRVPQNIRQRVIVAGEFLEKTARIRDAASYLRGIDFSHPVVVLRQLPDGVYAQYNVHLGNWFTLVGYPAQRLGISADGKPRTLYRPVGQVAALQSTARTTRDTWTKGRSVNQKLREKLLDAVKPMTLLDRDKKPRSLKEKEKFVDRRLGEDVGGGGIQYFVANKYQMTRVESSRSRW